MKVRLRVLIVEDSEDDARLLVRTLERKGFEITSLAVDTEEAMKAALETQSWDLVLSDYTMPAFDGIRALKTLRASGLDIPFILISGTIGEEVAVDAMKAGAHDYLLKGRLSRLAPAIERELREAEVRRARRAAEQALREAYAELETRVQERTEELASANEELASANEELRLHQEREIEAYKELDRQKDEFLSIAAHELRTPITSVLGFAQATLQHHEKRVLTPERLDRSLQVIIRQAQKLGSLVSQLLDVSRLEAGRLSLNRQSVDLVRVIRDVVVAVEGNTGQRSISVEAPARAMAFVDALRIEQVLTNLVSNAIKYGSDGLIEISLGTKDGLFAITVRDRGKGIPPEHLPHIFERFYRADDSHASSGLGLGLFIANQIVALHGGCIDVYSPSGGGAAFVVTLPPGNARHEQPADDQKDSLDGGQDKLSF